MVTRRAPGDIKAIDTRWKPGGAQFNLDALHLDALFDERGRKLTYDHLKKLGMGDPENDRPLCIGAIPRLTASLSVLYRTPATRQLRDKERKLLADTDPQVQTFAELAERMMLDNVWRLVDGKRNLMRQALLSFVESNALESVQARVFAPYETFRDPTPGAADVLDEDAAIALQLLDGARPEERIYQLWQHEDSGAWHLWIVNEGGALHGEQPYGEEGLVPFAELPLLMVYDSLPAGAAYLPIPESRLDLALNINALANDLAYLVKLEAHTVKVAITDDKGGVKVTQTGPDKMITMPGGSDMKLLAHTPQIEGVGKTLSLELSMLALGASLPADYFSPNRAVHTGPAQKASKEDLEARRQEQVSIAVQAERRAFIKYRAVHNQFANGWGLDKLDKGLTLRASFGLQSMPIDTKDLQEIFFKDIAIGAASILGYMQARFNLDRQGAIEEYERVQLERETYPVEQMQNPAAMIEGPMPAVGRGGAQKEPGAFNPDIETSTEGASVTDAAKQAVSPVN